MKLAPTFLHAILIIAACLVFHTSALAGTNDLFRSHITWQCTPTNSTAGAMRLTDRQLINLAMGNAVDTRTSSNLKLGLQCNCSNLEMNVIVYNATTLESVLTLADIFTDSYTSNDKIAHLTCSGSVHSNGFLLGGQLTVQAVARLDQDACIRQANLALSGAIEIQTSSGPVAMELRNSKLLSSGRQVRPVSMAGSGNYGGLEIFLGSIPSSPFVASIGAGNLTIGSNVVLNLTSVALVGGPLCDETFTISSTQSLLSSMSLLICSNSVINLSSGSILNVCTNGVSPDTINQLTNAVSGDGTMELTSTPF